MAVKTKRGPSGRLFSTMACAGCGLETTADFAFCPRCGRRLPAPCAACGSLCEPDFAFCPRCGAARSPAPAGADKTAAPVAHEDDPRRALDAALQMLERGAELGERWAARLGQRVVLHIGVHSGPVVAGSLGAAAGAAYAVTGDTVNTTARLLAAAAPGTILISEATHALTRHRFSFEPAGELTLRGKSESRSEE